jgi:hypothetical protein
MNIDQLTGFSSRLSRSSRTSDTVGRTQSRSLCHAFRFADLPPQNHPQTFMTLGMVLGLYGVLYLAVAHRPSEGFLIAAVGLAGKLLGPLGWLWLYLTGQWPLATGVILLTNDLIWWIPFALYLRDSSPRWRAHAVGAASRT